MAIVADETGFDCSCALVLLVVPLLLWGDYLRSIYRSTIFAGRDQFAVPGSAFLGTLGRVVSATVAGGLLSANVLQLCIVDFARRAGHLSWRATVDPSHRWWRVALGYVVLMLLIGRVLWDPTTGAITRVMLPVTVGFNVLLLRESSASPLLVVVRRRQPAPRCLVAG